MTHILHTQMKIKINCFTFLLFHQHHHLLFLVVHSPIGMLCSQQSIWLFFKRKKWTIIRYLKLSNGAINENIFLNCYTFIQVTASTYLICNFAFLFRAPCDFISCVLFSISFPFLFERSHFAHIPTCITSRDSCWQQFNASTVKIYKRYENFNNDIDIDDDDNNNDWTSCCLFYFINWHFGMKTAACFRKLIE